MSKKIEISYDEIQNFATELSDIISIVEKIYEEAEKIGGLTFYEHGQAVEAIAALKEIPLKYASIGDHYNRLLQILALTWQEMRDTDEKIAAMAGQQK